MPASQFHGTAIQHGKLLKEELEASAGIDYRSSCGWQDVKSVKEIRS